MTGGTACVLNHGLTRSGKSCTMFGVNGEAGILARSTEFFLSQTNDVSISAIEIFGNKYFDVVGGTRILLDHSQADRIQINSMSQFNTIQNNIIKARTQKATNQNTNSSRSHLFIKFHSISNPYSSMAFIDLAGWENPEGKVIEETKFINKTLTELNTVLIQIANNRIAIFNSPLLKLLKPYFSGSAKTLMLYHVSNTGAKKGLENIKDVIANIKGEKRKNDRNVLNEIQNKRFIYE